MSLHKEFFGFLFLAFVGWVFWGSTPNQRIERVCAPIHWVGNSVVSVSSLVLPAQQARVQRWFDKVEYGCRYITWRLIYQDDYNAWVAEQKKEEDAKADAAAAAKSPASADKSGTEKPVAAEKTPTAKPASVATPPLAPAQ